VDEYVDLGYSNAVDRMIDFEALPDDVDERIGKPGHVLVTARTEFLPRTNITDSRQRWLFRMVHSRRPLQEKMALFWHNHFATAYTKIQSGLGSAEEAARVLAAKPSEDPNRVKGQLELFREYALGNFRDLLIAVAKDPAILVWLDGRTNIKGRPQENFARELMELFTMGVDTFAEEDVYAGARVFTGWNLARPSNQSYQFSYVAAQHDTAAKEFTFPVVGASKVVPARPAPTPDSRTGSISSTRSHVIPPPARDWPGSSTPSSSTRSGRRIRPSSASCRASTTAAGSR
jgi:hypothetical protein